MGWKRRFENRVDVEISTPDPDLESSSINRQQSFKRVLNNKIYPCQTDKSLYRDKKVLQSSIKNRGGLKDWLKTKRCPLPYL